MLSAYLFLSPSIALFFLFKHFPIFYTLYLSLHRWRLGIVDRTFVGLHNYQLLITSDEFWQAVRNSLYYALGSIPLNMAISLTIAVLLNRQIRGRAIFRTAYFLPTITSTAAMAVVWMWIYHPDFGLANWILATLGLPRLRWLYDPRWAMPSLIIMGIWKGMGYNVIIYLAGLLAVLHFAWVVKGDLRVPLAYGAVVVLLLIVRSFCLARVSVAPLLRLHACPELLGEGLASRLVERLELHHHLLLLLRG